MTKLMEQAFAAVGRLPDQDQDAVAALLLEEIADEAKWEASFAKSADKLAWLAQQALAEYRAGRTLPQMDDDADL